MFASKILVNSLNIWYFSVLCPPTTRQKISKIFLNEVGLENLILNSFFSAISWSGSYKGYTLHRQKSISEFMAKLVNDGDDIFAQPETFLHLTEQAFQNDRGVHNIFEYLAIQVGYDKWLRKYMEVKNGGGAAKGKQARQGAEQAKEKEQIVSAILQSLENVSKEMHDEKGAEMSHHFHSTEANAAEEQEEEEEMAEVENAKSEQEILLRLQGKLIKVFTKMYLTIWDAPLNNKKQNLRVREGVFFFGE